MSRPAVAGEIPPTMMSRHGRSLLLGLALLAPAPVAAQGGWDDPAALTLVRAAVARRGAQLADSALRDYRARAHGFVTFLAQLGEGFALPPAVIKSDELMVDLLWQAPNRSAQRVVGRRDTLLLPSDMQYHRDHLGIVQNDFPAIIRLGDGDEVRDVPHPLSPAGMATYEFRVSDSLAIRAGTRAIDVVVVEVRPRDPNTPAAVGAVYLDRGTSAVVRMTLSFTRAALKDPQLEDVSVILENGLVDGRFWLPRRQEIEIRRTATWMDFPARGIIRGRWEICCVETNRSPPPERFAGPEITEAPRREQRAYPFEGAILEALPEEVRALDADEVRRVQEEARALVRAAALTRTRLTRPAARRVSDLVRVNRVEGLALGGGISHLLGGGLSVGVLGRVGLSDHAWKGRAAIGWRSARDARLELEGLVDFAEAGGIVEVSGLRNSIAAQEFGSDWTDPYRVAGGALRWQSAPSGRTRWGAELGRERHEPLTLAASPATGRYEPTLAIDPVTLSRIGVLWSRAAAPDPRAAQWTARVGMTGARVAPTAGGPSSALGRLEMEVEARRPIGGGTFVARSIGVGTTAGAGVPVQLGVFFGGPLTAPGHAFHALRGAAGLSQRVEWQRTIPGGTLSLGRFGRVPTTLTLAPYWHGVTLLDADRRGWRQEPAVGLGVSGLFDLLRLDVARPLRGGPWRLSIDLRRDLWPVL